MMKDAVAENSIGTRIQPIECGPNAISCWGLRGVAKRQVNTSCSEVAGLHTLGRDSGGKAFDA